MWLTEQIIHKNEIPFQVHVSLFEFGAQKNKITGSENLLFQRNKIEIQVKNLDSCRMGTDEEFILSYWLQHRIEKYTRKGCFDI